MTKHAKDLSENVEYYHSPKWIRAYFNGQLIVDSRNWVLQRSDGRPPVCFFPKQDVAMEFLNEVGAPPTEGPTRFWNIQVGQRIAPRAAFEYAQVKNMAPLQNCINIEWSSMDAWFEEQEEVFVHARDPRVRVDILHSSRHVKIIIHGETIAESRSPLLLFETGLPVRYYIPKIDVRMDLLIPSNHITLCPYKGEAHYYSVRIGDYAEENVAWYYRYPTLESAKIATYVAFYDEIAEEMEIDGIRQDKPSRY